MNNSLITVIVPVYKVENYLDECITSIINQTYNNLEIILVDDGSPDKCPEMCDRWAEIDSRIRVIHKENGGLSSARNVGIDSATGEFVFFLIVMINCFQTVCNLYGTLYEIILTLILSRETFV